ncbi:MAG: DUF2155 domain-containing protein [Magnetococcus sp. XQGC-1]
MSGVFLARGHLFDIGRRRLQPPEKAFSCKESGYVLRFFSLFLLTGVLAGGRFPVCVARAPLFLLPFLLLSGCSPEPKQESSYLSLEVRERDRLPLAPHVLASRARPTAAMTEEHKGVSLRFMILDKRTLKIHRVVAPVGQRIPAPWGGALYPVAFANDLTIREGRAMHGPDGYFNPAVWVVLEDGNGQPLHEGWLFVRDSAQTAWDHPRYDLTFLGMVESSTVGDPAQGAARSLAPAAPASSKKRLPPSPAGVAGPRDEAVDAEEDLQEPQD